MKKSKLSNHSSGFDKLSRESLRREWEVLKFAWQMAKRYHFLLFLLMLLEIIIGICPPAAVYFLQDTISDAGNDLLSLVTKDNFILVIILLFIYLLLQKGVSVITSFAIIDVEYNIRMKYLSKILTFPFDTISKYLDNSAAFSMTQETAMTSSLIPMIYRSFLRAPVTIVSAFVLLVIISPRMLALVMVMMAVIIGVNLLMRNKLKQFHRKQFDITSSLLQYFSDWLSGNRIFHVYVAEDFYKRKMTTAFDTIANVSKQRKLYGTALSILVEILTYIALVVFVVFMSDGEGYVDIGIVLSFPALLLMIRSEILKFVGGYQQLATTESSISRLQMVLQLQEPIAGKRIWKEQIDTIEFHDLSFGYDTNILRHADWKLSKGRLNVLTGPNGIGKSTTINLILGLFQPKDGMVCYNGKNIRDYNTSSFLSQFAIVEQEPFVFQSSLYDNITMGRDISEEVVRKYLHMFALEYLIGINGDLSLALEAKGRALSSGEKQRLALIRALIGDPSIIIMDEPTSNIDRSTTKLIREVMNEQCKQRLVICVSHDPEITTNKDYNLFVIENGNYSQY